MSVVGLPHPDDAPVFSCSPCSCAPSSFFPCMSDNAHAHHGPPKPAHQRPRTPHLFRRSILVRCRRTRSLLRADTPVSTYCTPWSTCTCLCKIHRLRITYKLAIIICGLSPILPLCHARIDVPYPLPYLSFDCRVHCCQIPFNLLALIKAEL